jgi:hypothetical protein
MTDKNDIIRQIEDLLGPEGSRDLAEAMLPILKRRGYVTFDADSGYELNLEYFNEDGEQWNSIIAEAYKA